MWCGQRHVVITVLLILLSQWAAVASSNNEDTETFACDDGLVIPRAFVEDGFCDCEDGSDETLTSACADGSFYCVNKGHQPHTIPSSLVHDGICDCCDGSDEKVDSTSRAIIDSSQLVQCENTCFELGKENRKKLREEIELHRKGHELKSVALENSKAEISKMEDEKKELVVQIEELSSEVERLKEVYEKLKKEVELVEEQQRKERERQKDLEKEQEEAKKDEQAEGTGEELDVDEEVKLKNGESQDTLGDFYRVDDDDEEGKAMRREALLREIDEMELAYAEETEREAQNSKDEDPPKVKEDEWVDDEADYYDLGEDEDEDEDEEVEEAAGIVVNADVEEGESSWRSTLQSFGSYVFGSTTSQEEPVPADPELQAKYEVAKNEYESSKGKLDKAQSRLDEINEILGKDYGPDYLFYSIRDECFEDKVDQYKYKLCMYDKTKQDHTNLGKWDGFGENSNYNLFHFKDGQSCWQGPKRSTVVNLSCGLENKILSVEEPSKCEYVMEFQTMLACSLEHAGLLQDQLKQQSIDKEANSS